MPASGPTVVRVQDQRDFTGPPTTGVMVYDSGTGRFSTSATIAKALVSSSGTWAVAEIPNLPASIITSGTLALARGGTNADLSATGGTGQYLKQSSSGAAITVGTIPASDVASGAALTKTDDTNVTLTLGGTPTTALLTASSLTLGWTGTLAVSRGGTGQATVAAAFDALAPSQTGNSGKYLTTNGTTASWGTVTVPSAAASTASIGLTRVVGVASTFMRSDEAQPLDVGIVPTWTGQHTFNTSAAVFGVGIITPKIYPSANSTTAISILKADGTTAIVTVDSTNSRIGIGTSSPLAPLHISAPNLSTGGAYNGYGNFLVSSNDADTVNFGGCLSLGGMSGGAVYTFGRVHGKKESASVGSALGYLSFETDNNSNLVERMRISSGGLVGIGMTPATAQLQVNATLSTTIGFQINLAASQSANAMEVNGSSGTVLTNITADGYLQLPAGTVSAPSLSWVSNNIGFYHTTGTLILTVSGTKSMKISALGIRLRGDATGGQIEWAASSDATAAADVGLWRNGAGIIEINTGTQGTFAGLKASLVQVKAGLSTGTAAKVGGCIFNHFADAGNTTTTETDLYTDTIAASTLGTNGDKVFGEYAGTFVSSGTATRQIKVYFAGTAIFDSGALTISATAAWNVEVEIIRVSSTVVRYAVVLLAGGLSGLTPPATGELTGLTLSNTAVLKITGTAAGVGAATNDIVAKMGYVEWASAA